MHARTHSCTHARTKHNHTKGVEGKTPVLWMHFLPFSQMTEEEKDEFQFICDYFFKYKSMHNGIYINGASIKKKKTSKKIIGCMYGAGWRGAYVTSMYQRYTFPCLL